MTVQMTIVFAVLVVEMVTLTLMVLPIPHAVRRKLVALIDVLSQSSNYKVGVVFLSGVLGLQFVDCVNKLRRLDYLKNPYYVNHISHDQLASKFYSQRNLYISGAVLYLELAIFTVSTILRKLVAKEDKLRGSSGAAGAAGTAAGATGAGDETELKEKIASKEKEIGALKSQIEGLQRSYDALNSSVGASKDE